MCLFSSLVLAKRTADYPPLLCFYGRSTENLCNISLLFPYNLAYNAPWPSIMINPKGESLSRRQYKLSVWNLLSQEKIYLLIGLKGSKSIIILFSPNPYESIPYLQQ